MKGTIEVLDLQYIFNNIRTISEEIMTEIFDTINEKVQLFEG